MKTFKSSALFLLFFLLPACGQQLVEFGDGGSGTAPVVTSTNPLSGATNVSLSTTISATFNEAMDPVTIIAANVSVTGPGGSVSGAVTYAAGSFAATFTPASNLATSATYTAKITTGVKDLAGNPMAANYTWSFTTAAAPDTTPPKVNSTDPVDLAVNVPVIKKITATFSEPMDPLTIIAAHFTVMNGANPIAGTVAYDAPNNIATFIPSSPLALGTTYTAQVTTGATDLAGNALASGVVPNPWHFTTALTQDTTPPLVSFTAPANTETNVAINRKIVATFNEAMNPATIVAANISVTGPSGSISGGVTYAAGSFAATFTPAANLATSTPYTAKITTGVKDLAGNPMAVDYIWSFTTGASPDLTAPKISSTNPADLAVNVPIDKKIAAAFTKPMDPLTIITANFTLMNGVTPVAGTVAYDVPNSIATFTPLSPLAFSTTYTALVTTGATDLAGNALVSGLVPNPWSFKTSTGPVTGVNLGLAAPFAIAATAGVTNTITAPITHINGDVVLDPNQTCNAVVVDNAGGFGLCNNMAPTINGTVITNVYPDTTTSTAVKADLNAAFLSITPLAGPPAVGSLGGGIPIAAPTTLGDVAGAPHVLGDNWFTPGVYISITSILITGDITLDGQGDSNAVFIFQSASTLTTADGAPSPGAHTRILLTNGTKASNVWWQVASSATIGLYSEFQGNILAAFDITMKTGSTACGRSMAGAWVGGAGAFVFDSNVVSVPGNGCPL